MNTNCNKKRPDSPRIGALAAWTCLAIALMCVSTLAFAGGSGGGSILSSLIQQLADIWAEFKALLIFFAFVVCVVVAIMTRSLMITLFLIGICVFIGFGLEIALDIGGADPGAFGGE